MLYDPTILDENVLIGQIWRGLMIHQDRLHWIVSNVIGDRVLDAGCGHGATSILLARLGKKVEGFDTDPTAIEFALEAVSSESEETKRNVSFEVTDISNGHFKDVYDTIILTLNMEHPIDLEVTLERARDLVQPEGRVLINAPFGLNDASNGNDVAYGPALVLELTKSFHKIEMEVLDSRFLCISCVRKPHVTALERGPVLRDLMEKLEREMLEKERRILLDRDRLRSNVQEISAISRTSQESIRNLQNVTNESTVLLRTMLEQQVAIAERYREVSEKLTKDYSELQSRSEIIRVERERLALVSSHLEAELNIARGNLQRSMEEIGAMAAQATIKEKDLGTLTSQNSSLMVQVETLKLQLDAREKRMDELQALEKETRRKLSQSEKVSSDLNKELQLRSKELERTKVLYEAESKKLREVAKRLERELSEEERVVREIERLQKRNKVLTARFESLANSPLGKLMIQIWAVYNQIRGKK